MNSFVPVEPFVVRALLPTNLPSLFTHDEALALEQQLHARLDALPPGALLPIDFEGVRIASEAARQLLRRAIVRLTNGELEDRYVILTRLGTSRYNVKVMLVGEGIVLPHRNVESPELLGQVEQSARETFDFMAHERVVSARDVLKHFGLQNISAATNRLTALARLALARRVDQRPIPGGGREYLFAAVQ